MKKQIIALSLGLITISSFAQKKELKIAEKALKKNDYTTALASIKPIEGTIKDAKDKYKSKYYFIKGQALAGQNKLAESAETFNQLLAFEKKIGKDRYGSKATPILNKMIQKVSNKAVDLYNVKKDYAAAANNFYLTYKLSPKDTSFVFNAAVSATQAKDYEGALKYYRELQRVGYTGREIQYLATDKTSGKVTNLGSKRQRDLMVKAGQYNKPETKLTESKKAVIVKNIALILKTQGKTDEAIAAMKEARKENPKDLNLILNEAELYITLKKMDKFGELMNEAIALDPKNPTLYYNLGVVNGNQGRVTEAKKYYQKAIDLKPDYADAYMNMSSVILSEDQVIVEKMNKNLSNFKEYDKLAAQQKALYSKALPFVEKADELKRSTNTVKVLMGIYESLELEGKASKYRELYKSFK